MYQTVNAEWGGNTTKLTEYVYIYIYDTIFCDLRHTNTMKMLMKMVESYNNFPVQSADGV